jgi:hypothetical protein
MYDAHDMVGITLVIRWGMGWVCWRNVGGLSNGINGLAGGATARHMAGCGNRNGINGLEGM